MALRVLLADESSTIKKVMQLALQDFSVEVKAVPVGLDVLPVAKNFKPDIVFADVLLTKRSGYEVCADLKNDPQTASLPVVLMWSGFMEIDEPRARASRADRRLEKPFDAETLRGMVRELVEKTRTNPVADYLSIPRLPDFEEPPRPPSPNATPVEALPEISDEEAYGLPHDSDDGALDLPAGEEFSHVPLTATPSIDNAVPADDGEWSHQSLSPLKTPPAAPSAEAFGSKFTIPKEELSHAHVEVSGNFEEISFEDLKPISGKKRGTATGSQNRDITPEMLEKNLQGQAREVIESICWKILPEIAERVIREEIQKMLRESEK